MLKDDSVCLEEKKKRGGRRSEPAEGKEEMQSSHRGSLLQHRQKRCRFHIWDVDFIVVLGQLAVEHGVEHRAAHGQNILWEDRKEKKVKKNICRK